MENEYKICMSYCKHGGICKKHGDHKKHDSGFCKWNDDEGLTKQEADKILKEKLPIIGKLIADTETLLLNELGIEY